MGAPIEIGHDEARRRAEEELAKAKYQGMPDWLNDLLQRLDELLEGITRGPSGPDGLGGSSWVLLVVVVVILAALVLIVWKVGLPRWRPKTVDAEVETDPEVAPSHYRTAAERAAAAQDWTSAIRERFRALVRELEHRTILEPRPGRTALEAAGRAARMLPSVEPQLHRAALGFNDVMYGQIQADQERYAAMVAADEDVLAAARQYRHANVDRDAVRDASQSMGPR